VDEAHHAFRGATRAYEFFRDVVDPDATMLVTATPRDADVEAFKVSTHLGNMRRIKVSRAEGVDADLLKQGIKTAVFKAPETVNVLLDFKRTALTQAVAAHRRVKELLASAGMAMTPLLLVQVDSEPGSEERAREWLRDLGFQRDAVMTHVDRRLQGQSTLPAELSYGYVFLSDRASQTGILSAGDRINGIRSELASLETHVDVAFFSDGRAGDFFRHCRRADRNPRAPDAGRNFQTRPILAGISRPRWFYGQASTVRRSRGEARHGSRPKRAFRFWHT
jgi:hypothetical protein